MESIFSFIVDHASSAHYFVFLCFMLAGINFPISEDLLIIFSAVLASTVVPENWLKLFLAVFLGAFLSDWIPYWVGRKWGIHICKWKWFCRLVESKKFRVVQKNYLRFGSLTLFLGRFIPFGIRNCLFAVAGISRMPFGKFLLVDGCACFISNTTLFFLSYFCGKNFEILKNQLRWVNLGFFFFFLVALIAFFCYKKILRSTHTNKE